MGDERNCFHHWTLTPIALKSVLMMSLKGEMKLYCLNNWNWSFQNCFRYFQFHVEGLLEWWSQSVACHAHYEHAIPDYLHHETLKCKTIPIDYFIQILQLHKECHDGVSIPMEQCWHGKMVLVSESWWTKLWCVKRAFWPGNTSGHCGHW